MLQNCSVGQQILQVKLWILWSWLSKFGGWIFLTDQAVHAYLILSKMLSLLSCCSWQRRSPYPWKSRAWDATSTKSRCSCNYEVRETSKCRKKWSSRQFQLLIVLKQTYLRGNLHNPHYFVILMLHHLYWVFLCSPRRYSSLLAQVKNIMRAIYWHPLAWLVLPIKALCLQLWLRTDARPPPGSSLFYPCSFLPSRAKWLPLFSSDAVQPWRAPS